MDTTLEFIFLDFKNSNLIKYIKGNSFNKINIKENRISINPNLNGLIKIKEYYYDRIQLFNEEKKIDYNIRIIPNKNNIYYFFLNNNEKHSFEINIEENKDEFSDKILLIKNKNEYYTLTESTKFPFENKYRFNIINIQKDFLPDYHCKTADYSYFDQICIWKYYNNSNIYYKYALFNIKLYSDLKEEKEICPIDINKLSQIQIQLKNFFETIQREINSFKSEKNYEIIKIKSDINDEIEEGIRIFNQIKYYYNNLEKFINYKIKELNKEILNEINTINNKTNNLLEQIPIFENKVNIENNNIENIKKEFNKYKNQLINEIQKLKLLINIDFSEIQNILKFSLNLSYLKYDFENTFLFSDNISFQFSKLFEIIGKYPSPLFNYLINPFNFNNKNINYNELFICIYYFSTYFIYSKLLYNYDNFYLNQNNTLFFINIFSKTNKFYNDLNIISNFEEKTKLFITYISYIPELINSQSKYFFNKGIIDIISEKNINIYSEALKFWKKVIKELTPLSSLSKTFLALYSNYSNNLFSEKEEKINEINMIPFDYIKEIILNKFPKYMIRFCSGIIPESSTTNGTLIITFDEINIFSKILKENELNDVNNYDIINAIYYRILHECGHQINFYFHNLNSSPEKIININNSIEPIIQIPFESGKLIENTITKKKDYHIFLQSPFKSEKLFKTKLWIGNFEELNIKIKNILSGKKSNLKRNKIKDNFIPEFNIKKKSGLSFLDFSDLDESYNSDLSFEDEYENKNLSKEFGHKIFVRESLINKNTFK